MDAPYWPCEERLVDSRVGNDSMWRGEKAGNSVVASTDQRLRHYVATSSPRAVISRMITFPIKEGVLILLFGRKKTGTAKCIRGAR